MFVQRINHQDRAIRYCFRFLMGNDLLNNYDRVGYFREDIDIKIGEF